MDEEQKRLVVEVMRIIGSIKTDKKAAASRINGKKGGRPKKQETEQEKKSASD